MDLYMLSRFGSVNETLHRASATITSTGHLWLASSKGLRAKDIPLMTHRVALFFLLLEKTFWLLFFFSRSPDPEPPGRMPCDQGRSLEICCVYSHENVICLSLPFPAHSPLAEFFHQGVEAKVIHIFVVRFFLSVCLTLNSFLGGKARGMESIV